MAAFLKRLSTHYAEPRTSKKAKRYSFISYGRNSVVSKDMVKVDLSTCHPLGDVPTQPQISNPLQPWTSTSSSTSDSDTALSPQWSAGSGPSSPSASTRASWCQSPSHRSSASSVYSKRNSSILSDSSSSTASLKTLLQQPEMNTVLRGRTGYTRTLHVQGVRVTFADERIPELIGSVPYLRSIWTFWLLDAYKYDVDDTVLRRAMAAAPIAICNHLIARAPDGYGEPGIYGGWPARQEDEECIPDDGFRLSVQCRSCEAMYSVEVVSTHSAQWDGTFEPYLQVQSWRPV